MSRCLELRLSRRPTRPALPAARIALEALEARAAPAAGQLDPTFGTGGFTVGPEVSYAAGQAVLQSGGRIVTLHSTADGGLLLTRYAAIGAPDGTFGQGGSVTTSTPGYYTNSLALLALPGGGLLAAGVGYPPVIDPPDVIGPPSPRLVLARYTADGAPDGSFGQGGVLTTAVAGVTNFPLPKLAVQADGKILVAGADSAGFVVTRLNADGSPDPTFGQGGMARVSFADAFGNGPVAVALAGVAVQADGRIVVAGSASEGNYGGPPFVIGGGQQPVYSINTYSLALARLNADGSPDPTFGAGGRSLTPVSGPNGQLDAAAAALALAPDGGIVVGGTVRAGGPKPIPLAAGAAPPASAQPLYPTSLPQYLVARFNPAGRLDSGFGQQGVALGPFTPGNTTDYFTLDALAVDAAGRILFAGNAGSTVASYLGPPLLVARLTTTGAPDPAFGAGGVALVPPPPPGANGFRSAQASTLLLTPSGRVVLDGLATGDPQPHQLLIGLQGDNSVVTPLPVVPLAVGAAAGGLPQVNLYDPATGALLRSFLAYDPSFTGGVRVAVGDVTGDGIPDVITGAGPGGGPHVKVFDGATGQEVRSFFAFDPAFTGGVTVAAGDVTGDGITDLIVGAGPGGGPHVKVFDGRTEAEVLSFFAYDPAFAGGVSVAAADIGPNDRAEIVTGAGAGGGPNVKVFGSGGPELTSFFAYDPSFAGGVTVAAGDLTGTGVPEIVTGAGPGGGPHVKVFNMIGMERESLFAYDPAFTGGVSVAVTPSASGPALLATGAGPGGGPHVEVFGPDMGRPVQQFFAFDPTFSGGVTVG